MDKTKVVVFIALCLGISWALWQFLDFLGFGFFGKLAICVIFSVIAAARFFFDNEEDQAEDEDKDDDDSDEDKDEVDDDDRASNR